MNWATGVVGSKLLDMVPEDPYRSKLDVGPTWRGSLVCDDCSGYKQLMLQGVTEVGCLARGRRKFFDLHAAHKSPVAQRALEQIAQVYEIERTRSIKHVLELLAVT